MQIRFWGTRGSVPAPGENTVEFGGNTSCVEVILKSGTSIIFDAGTGIRAFGLDYLSRKNAPRTIHLFLSHAHWDHIQGFPFFVPAILADFTIHIYSHMDARKVLGGQMSQPYFPVSLDIFQSTKKFHRLKDKPVKIDDAIISEQSLHHPQSVRGFRVDEDGASIVYSTDTEHGDKEFDKSLISFARGTDALIYDAQYTPEEYESGRIGWGHSTYAEGVNIAKKAGVKKLVLFHHEPTHNDKTVRAIESKTKKLFRSTIAAREGLTLNIP